ncbi:Endonuclease/exonuclease/phosphatase [Podospora didyma]|uniref:Endonuclease/exonuclease/phosphatase n=1 Tax=Podospora didyma TaxID=330526 RepID=A0AAE0NTV2_9PEZI|nr:Endonuclease/exonuclease/phosphatase [Podospora didyma]
MPVSGLLRPVSMRNHHSIISPRSPRKQQYLKIAMFTYQRWKKNEPEPITQHYFEYVDGVWSPIEPGSCANNAVEALAKLSILSWNIDFMRNLQEARMKAALNHVRELVKRNEPLPCVVMFNEMVEGDLKLIMTQDWIQKGYRITDISNLYWDSPRYGTTMLVHKSIPVKSIFRVHYANTSMGRDVLFADIELPHENVLRIGSTHLESLIAGPPKRPSQLATAASYMHKVHAGIIGGDMNAIEPFDKTLHLDNKLKDAYLETGGKECSDAGMTWGQMASRWSRERYGLTRMDKLMFCGCLEVESFETFGMDVEVEDEGDRKKLIEDTSADIEKAWVTDHLGVKAVFNLVVPPS